ncbi:MAG: histidinol-phosphate transaminase [Alphaproteobacteria bacterium]|nr:histidinol-phosphate transaminase [Alphaproteobacteria bacterium]
MAHPAPKPGIMDITPYIGGEGRVPETQRLARLASNENPLGPSPLAMKAYIDAAKNLHRYPDGMAADLRAALGQKYGMDPARIVCGAGSDELIALLTRAYAGAGDEIVYSAHGFLRYKLAAMEMGATPKAVPEQNLTADMDALLEAVTERTKILFLANPNNPTGSWLDRNALQKLASRLPSSVLFVIDAAYSEFMTDPAYESGQALVDAHKNVVMLRTFSKIYGLSALRLGWGYFPEEIASVLNRIRGPFNVSAPAQAAGIAALDDDDFLQRTIALTEEQKQTMTTGLKQLGFQVYPSAGNFLLAQFGAEAEKIRLALKERGVFVRQMGAYGLPETLRISIGMAEDTDQLLTALKEIKG